MQFQLEKTLIIGMAIAKKAAAKANMDSKHLDKKTGEAIIAACKDIVDNDNMHHLFVVDSIDNGLGGSVNQIANKVIAEKSGTSEKDVNMSQKDEEIYSVTSRIASMMELDKLVDKLESLIFAIENRGSKFETYSTVLRRDLSRIKNVRHNLCGVSLKSNDSNFLLHFVEYLARYSKKPLYIIDNPSDFVQNTDAYAETSSTLKICMLNLSKINSSNLGVTQVAYQVSGNDLTISMASVAGQSVEPLLAFNLIQTISLMADAIDILIKEYE